MGYEENPKNERIYLTSTKISTIAPEEGELNSRSCETPKRRNYLTMSMKT